YALIEWARTDEFDRDVRSSRFSTLLAEGAWCRAGAVAAVRVERTDRHEEEQTLDPFRSPRPPIDLTNLGVSRWTTLTLALSAPALAGGMVTGRPFIEVARISAKPGEPPGLF